ncbi:MAG: DUF934 domain-containing protein [Motiliproteus sp.]
MPNVIKDGGIVEDSWQLIEMAETETFSPQPKQQYILPLSFWLGLANGDGSALDAFDCLPGIWIDGDQDLEPFAERISKLPLVAIRFGAFSDGTGFSTGALLREAYGYQGELRAFGDVIADQVSSLRRCGFNVFSLQDNENLETACAQLVNSSLSYQGSIYNPRTPFKFRY